MSELSRRYRDPYEELKAILSLSAQYPLATSAGTDQEWDMRFREALAQILGASAHHIAQRHPNQSTSRVSAGTNWMLRTTRNIRHSRLASATPTIEHRDPRTDVMGRHLKLDNATNNMTGLSVRSHIEVEYSSPTTRESYRSYLFSGRKVESESRQATTLNFDATE